VIWGSRQKIQRLEVEREAGVLLTRMGVNSLPVDPFAIARAHDIEVEAKHSRVAGASGCLVRIGNTFGILYARHIQVKGFIRFTVAHELGHYFLPGHAELLFPCGDGTHQSRSGFVSDDPCEVEADFFAAALLMPERLFRQALIRAGNGFPAIEELASQCRTSITATAIRLAQYADDPVAVLVSGSGKIDYCFLSEALQSHLSKAERYQKGKLVPQSTATAELQKNPADVGASQRREGSCSLSDWFDGAPRWRCKRMSWG